MDKVAIGIWHTKFDGHNKVGSVSLTRPVIRRVVVSSGVY
jgi:hypothetical protein